VTLTHGQPVLPAWSNAAKLQSDRVDILGEDFGVRPPATVNLF